MIIHHLPSFTALKYIDYLDHILKSSKFNVNKHL